MKDGKPVIGISGSSAQSESVKAMMTLVDQMGGIPLLLANHGARKPAEDILKIDAYVNMGNNNDLDPKAYGDLTVDPHTKIEGVVGSGAASEAEAKAQATRRDYEIAMLQEAEARNMPILGVCGGMQRINTLYREDGGTLIQHIEHHNQGKLPGFISIQYANIRPDTKLGQVSTAPSVAMPAHGVQAEEKAKPEAVNSLHHQAVKNIRKGFIASAISEDGVVEAIEVDPKGKYAGKFILGVQWHPEFMPSSDLSKNLIKTVVQKGLDYARTCDQEIVRPAPDVLAETLKSSLDVLDEEQRPVVEILAQTTPVSFANIIRNKRAIANTPPAKGLSV